MANNASAPRVLQLLPQLDRDEWVQAAIGVVEPIAATGGLAVVGSPGGRLEPQLERSGGTLVRLESARPPIFGRDPNVETLANCCRERKLRLIHAHGLALAGLGAAVADETGVPFIVSCHELPDRNSIATRLQLRSLAKARRVMTASNFLAEEIRRRVPRLADRIEVVSHGINIEAFDEAAVTTARTISLADAWGVVEDPRPIILVPAHLDEEEWCLRIYRVVEQTVHRQDGELDAQFVIFGDDQGSGRAVKLSNRLLSSGLAEHVRLVGHCADPEAALKLSSVVLAIYGTPSGVCHTALQAQAMGRPVILGNSGAAPEAIEDGVTGWLVPPDAPEETAQRVLSALSLDASERAHLALAARARIVTNNSTETMNRHLIALYEELWTTLGAA